MMTSPMKPLCCLGRCPQAALDERGHLVLVETTEGTQVRMVVTAPRQLLAFLREHESELAQTAAG